MNKQPIGLCIGNVFKLPLAEALPQIKDIGFDAVSPVWNKEPSVLERTVQQARDLGFTIQSLHAPHRGAGDLWSRDCTVSTPSL